MLFVKNNRKQECEEIEEKDMILRGGPLRWLELVDMNLSKRSKLWKIVKDREAWPAAVHGGCKEPDTT